jgi:hypothetical protein
MAADHICCRNGRTLLHKAVEQKQHNIVFLQELLDTKKIDVDAMPRSPVSAFNWFDAHSTISKQKPPKSTALIEAAAHNFVPAIQLLLSAHADPNITTPWVPGEYASLLHCADAGFNTGMPMVKQPFTKRQNKGTLRRLPF